jgi:alpha-L-rhamnosidase
MKLHLNTNATRHSFRGLMGACLLAAIGLLSAQEVSGSLAPHRLRCEYLENPLGIDVVVPRFSWELQAVDPQARGLGQRGYRVLVASTRDKLDRDEGDLWDSGDVRSKETLGIEYAGKELKSRQHCYWKVKVQSAQTGAEGTEKEPTSAWSEPAEWTMGLLGPRDWSASWISYPTPGPAREAHFGYQSATAPRADTEKWVQIDLGKTRRFDSVRLWGAWPMGRQAAPGHGFPVRFKIEVADTADFSGSRMVVDRTGAEVPNPSLEPVRLEFASTQARYVRLTATRLTAAFWQAVWDAGNERWKPEPGSGHWRLALAEMEVIDGGENIARGAAVTALDASDDDPKANTILRDFAETQVHGGWSRDRLTDGRIKADLGPRFEMLPVTHLRKQFVIRQPVRRAILYATSLGCYEFRLNGKQVGDQRLAPGWTIYEKRVLYQTYDVSRQLHMGENALGALLADGWFRMPGQIDFFDSNARFAGYFHADDRWLLGQLEIEYEDGSREVVATDGSWVCHTDGPWRRTAIFDGAHYDARRELPGWDRPGYRGGQDWHAVVTRPLGAIPALSAQMMQPIRVLQEVKPVGRSSPQPGVHIFDFGKHLSGVCRIQVDGAAGTAVKLRFGEALHPDGRLYVANLLGAYDNHDLLILDGRGPVDFTAKFTYHGFRYVEVTGVSSPKDILGITAEETMSDLRRIAHFESSDSRLDKLVEIIERAYRSCTPSLIVDVSARDERMPWMGDCYTEHAGSLSYLFDFAAFGANLHRNIADSLNSEGISPEMLAKVREEGADAIANWSDSGVMPPFDVWTHYADRRGLERAYAGASRYMDTIARYNPDGVPRKRYITRYGDWLGAKMTIPPAATAWEPKGGKGAPGDLFGAAFWAHSADTVSRMAEALHKFEDAARYRALADKIRAALVANHVKPDGTVSGNEQGSYALVLGQGHLDSELRDKAGRMLLESIRSYREHLATGSVSNIPLLRYLAENGHQDLAYRMVMQPTCPSFGFMVDNGATAMWERYDGWHPVLGFNPSPMNAFNHLGMNAIFEWIFGSVGGIRPDPEQPGYKHFFISPKSPKGLDWVKVRYDSVRGPISVEWKKENGKLVWNVTVPPNTTATAYIPSSSAEDVTESGKSLAKSEGVKFTKIENGRALCELQSGTYRFESKQEEKKQR